MGGDEVEFTVGALYWFAWSQRRCPSKQTFKDCHISNFNVVNFSSTWDVFEFEFNHKRGGEFEFTMGAFYRFVSSERLVFLETQAFNRLLYFKFQRGDFNSPWGVINSNSPWERSCRFVSSEPRCSSKQTFKDCHISNFNVVNFSSTWDVFEFEFNHKRGGEFELTMGAFYMFVSSDRRCSSKANFQQIVIFRISTWGF